MKTLKSLTFITISVSLVIISAIIIGAQNFHLILNGKDFLLIPIYLISFMFFWALWTYVGEKYLQV